MPAFLSQSNLSRGDLSLILTNDLGYRVDPYSVKWTVFTNTGIRVSGNRLPAIRAGTGEYYAPWGICAKGGCHQITWEYQIEPGCEVIQHSESFFVIDRNRFCCSSAACSAVAPSAGCTTFMLGSLLGRGDLSIFLKDGDGIPLNAYSVTWQIVDMCGCVVTPERAGVQATVGEYYADWYVNVLGGDYTIRWKVIETIDSPAQSFSQSISIISPTTSICSSVGIFGVPCDADSVCLVSYSLSLVPCYGHPSFSNCGTPCSIAPSSMVCPVMPTNCCDFEIPRIVHLAEQNLPAGGAFTNQPAYSIPSRIRTVTFYIKYRRNSAGGRGSFKLLWGNGTEEAQSTLIDEAFTDINATSSQSMFLNVYNGPTPSNNDFITFSIETVVPGGSKTVRLLASELGVPMDPGVIEITLTAST